MRSPLSSSLTAVLALLCIAPQGHAQLLASEPSSVSQTVDGTKITVAYHRPKARGRTGVFGTTVHWGEIWTPGANAATTMDVTKDVTIEGQNVPKGKYSVWIVIERGDWEMLLVGDTTLFHTQRPKRGAPGQIRFAVKRERKPFLETLTWSFPDVASTGMTLAMQWDTVSVPLRIKVPASYTTVVAEDVARRVAGKYHLHFEPMPGPPADSSSSEEKPPTDVTFTIRQEGGELRALMDPPMFKTEPGYTHWILIPRKGGWYHLGRFDQNELVEIFDFFAVQFDAVGAQAKGFEIRLANDKLIGKATRLP